MKTSLTINFEGNVGEGWTAQMVEYPEAAARGDQLLEAAVNVLLAVQEALQESIASE